eukprot:10143739-Alexandrium_andersonii.AAC.1
MAAVRGILAGKIKEHIDLRMAEGDIPVSEMIKEFRRYAGLRRAEARIRRNDDDMDVGAVQASTPSPAQEAPPAER